MHAEQAFAEDAVVSNKAINQLQNSAVTDWTFNGPIQVLCPFSDSQGAAWLHFLLTGVGLCQFIHQTATDQCSASVGHSSPAGYLTFRDSRPSRSPLPPPQSPLLTARIGSGRGGIWAHSATGV